MSNNPTGSLADVQDTAVAALRRSQSAEGSDYTDALRDTARSFVDARAHFYTADGETDWRGRTHAYRAWVRETMGEAGVPPEERATLQAAIRYHVGTALRERLDDETLERYGLKKSTPRERSVQKRARLSETLSFFSGGAVVDDRDEVLSLCRLISSALARVDESALVALPSADRRVVREALGAVEARAAALVQAAGARRRKSSE